MKRLWGNIYFRHLIYWLIAYAVVFFSVVLYESSLIGFQVATLVILPALLPVYSHFYILERFFLVREYLYYGIAMIGIIFISG
ncbi:hypothetical protein ACFLR4_02545, partial [Bacteroidota bacterium]